MSAERVLLMRAAKHVVESSPSLRSFGVEGELPCYGAGGEVKHYLRVKDPSAWEHRADDLGATVCWVRVD